MLFGKLLFAAITAVAKPVTNVNSVGTQIDARDVQYNSVISGILNSLTIGEQDFITFHLRTLQSYNGTSCEKCHNKIRYSQELIKKDEDKHYLISLMLYEYCLFQHKNKDSKCEFIDFFITTNTKTDEDLNENAGAAGSFNGPTSLNFFDNDYVQMIKNFNVSSELSLNYYCYYKGGYCELPETPDISTIIDLESMWPEKKEAYNLEPKYNSSLDLFNVLHLSDVHNELRYQVGSESNCTQGICCLPESYNLESIDPSYNFTSVYSQAGAGMIELSFYPEAHFENESYVAGEYYDFPLYRGWNWVWAPASTWGNYDCDPPEVMLNHTFKYIGSTSELNNYEFAIFTGDIVDHDVIHCDANVTRTAEIRTYKMMKQFLNKIPLYPTLGNHDTFPYGQLSPKSLNNKTLNESAYHWNEELMAELWISNGWINDSTKDDITNHYAAFSTTTNRGLKIISLNSNCYYQKNLYNYINMEVEADLFGQWEFLIKELVESEKIAQRVWIMAHISPGDYDALPIQSNIFAKIVERFSPYTIANIFYGHTHRDQFKVLYNDNGEALNMAWISQAITPLGPANPSWRYYQVQEESFNIINAYNYYTPLNETWVRGSAEPQWKYEYSPRDAYDPDGEWPALSPLNATFWDKFVVQKIKNKTNIELNQLFTNLLYRLNPYVPSCDNGTSITSSCYIDNYCDIIGFKVDDYNKCIG